MTADIFKYTYKNSSCKSELEEISTSGSVVNLEAWLNT